MICAAGVKVVLKLLKSLWVLDDAYKLIGHPVKAFPRLATVVGARPQNKVFDNAAVTTARSVLSSRPFIEPELTVLFEKMIGAFLERN